MIRGPRNENPGANGRTGAARVNRGSNCYFNYNHFSPEDQVVFNKSLTVGVYA